MVVCTGIPYCSGDFFEVWKDPLGEDEFREYVRCKVIFPVRISYFNGEHRDVDALGYGLIRTENRLERALFYLSKESQKFKIDYILFSNFEKARKIFQIPELREIDKLKNE